MIRALTTGSRRYSPLLRLTNKAIGTPQARWRLITQSGRPSTIALIRFFERSGTQRVSLIAPTATERSVLSPSPSGEGFGVGESGEAGAEEEFSAPLSSRSIAMNHCGVQRKMILALDRQLCG